MTVREALLAMGYRESKPGHWLKPIGFQCFSYHEAKQEWANWFRSANGVVECWETKSLKDDGSETALQRLKGFECWTRCDISADCNSQFQLSAIDM